MKLKYFKRVIVTNKTTFLEMILFAMMAMAATSIFINVNIKVVCHEGYTGNRRTPLDGEYFNLAFLILNCPYKCSETKLK